MALAFHGIATRCIIVAGHIQCIQAGRRCLIRRFSIGGLIHTGTHHGCNQIEHGGIHAGCLIHILVHAAFFVVNALSLLGIGNNHQVETTGNRTRTVSLLQECDHLFGFLDALFFGRLGNLIADGVHNDGGMVVIPVNHGLEIIQIVLAPVGGIVELILMMEPHIPTLIHHVDTVIVASIQHSTGSGIMGRSDGIEACILHDANTAPIRFIGSCGTQNAIVMVDTATPEKSALPVDIETLIIPADGTDAEGSYCFIVLDTDFASVEVGIFVTPQLSIRYNDVLIRAIALGNNSIAIQNLDLCVFMTGIDMDGCGFDGKSMDSDLFRLKSAFGAGPHHHRAVDTGTGIPPGVGLIGIFAFHADGILSLNQKLVCAYEEGQIAIFGATGFFAVDVHNRVLINPVKLEQDMFCLWIWESLFVNVFSTREEGSCAAAGIVCLADLMDHSIVWQMHPCSITSPVGIKIMSFHSLTSRILVR